MEDLDDTRLTSRLAQIARKQVVYATVKRDTNLKRSELHRTQTALEVAREDLQRAATEGQAKLEQTAVKGKALREENEKLAANGNALKEENEKAAAEGQVLLEQKERLAAEVNGLQAGRDARAGEGYATQVENEGETRFRINERGAQGHHSSITINITGVPSNFTLVVSQAAAVTAS
jgi:septal ring factor EnvC (AmiA/AmiB activator)